MDFTLFKSLLAKCQVSVRQVLGLEKRLSALEEGGGAGGNHAALSNLDYASAAHTGFQPALGFTAVPNTRTVNGQALTDNIIIDTGGEGVPAGGADEQILAKASAVDYDTEWIDAPAGGGGEAPAFLYLPMLPTDNADNAADYTTRVVCGPIFNSGNMVRFKLQGHSSGTCAIDNASVGISSGTAGNTTDVPVELLFSGGHGCTIPAGPNGIWTDWTSLSVTGLAFLVFVIDYSSSGAQARRYVASYGSCATYYKAATNSYDQATLTGYSTSAGQVWHVQAINVKTV